MAAVSAALALLGGVIGAGFASGREIVCFFARHGIWAPAACAAALATLCALFVRLPALLERGGCRTLSGLCAARLGVRFGALCSCLFLLLAAVTGGAMLAACAELGALTLPVHGAYPLAMALTLLPAAILARRSMAGLALPGALLLALMPVLLVRLLALPAGEAAFAGNASRPLHALFSGCIYGALSAAQLAGLLPLLLDMNARERRTAVCLFALLFGALLTMGVLVLRQHLSAALYQPLPLVWLSRPLGKSGYYLCAACMYAAAFSTLCAMLRILAASLPAESPRFFLSACLCLFFALIGFDSLVGRGYPVLGALCAGLLMVLCLPTMLKKNASA